MGDNSIRVRALKATPPEEVVTVPEWDGAKVLVVGFTMHEQQEFLQSLTVVDSVTGERVQKPDHRERMTTQLIIRTVHDPDTREPVFTQADAQAILTQMAAGPLSRLFTVCSRLAGLTADTSAEEAKLAADPTGGPS
jgi:hypothetical protein